jgi:hypothetical protein
MTPVFAFTVGAACGLVGLYLLIVWLEDVR